MRAVPARAPGRAPSRCGVSGEECGVCGRRIEMTKQVQRMVSRCSCVLVLGLALAVWADAPPGRYTFTTDTVVDTVTQLTWQRNPPIAYDSWAGARTYCTNLNLG